MDLYRQLLGKLVNLDICHNLRLATILHPRENTWEWNSFYDAESETGNGGRRVKIETYEIPGEGSLWTKE